MSNSKQLTTGGQSRRFKHVHSTGLALPTEVNLQIKVRGLPSATGLRRRFTLPLHVRLPPIERRLDQIEQRCDHYSSRLPTSFLSHGVSTRINTPGMIEDTTNRSWGDKGVKSHCLPDSRNVLSTISLAGTNIDSRSYDAGGRLTGETLGNGQVVTRTYLTGDNLSALIANAAVGNYTYGWDANKNKTSEGITGAMSGYGFSVPTGGYDDQNRLTGWNRRGGTVNSDSDTSEE